MMTENRTLLQRPAGYAPKGTSFGILGCTLLTLTPFATTATLIPVVPDGTRLMIGAMVPSFLACVPLALITALGLHRRRLWYIRFLFGWGVAGLVSYAVGTGVLLIELLHGFPEHHPELRGLLIVAGISWAGLTLGAFWVQRMLRLRYWQPWTRPAQWEPGDETGPSWATRP